MVDTYGGPFAALAAMTEPVTAAAQLEIIANINAVKDLIPDPDANDSAAHPDFDQIPAHTAAKLRAELDALIANVDAAATA